MRTLGLSLLVVGLALAALPAHAEQTGVTSYTLIAKNPDFVWTNDQGAQNPTIEVTGGQEITITVKNDPNQDGFHALQVGSGVKSDDIEKAGDSVTYKFTAPATGNVQYVCPYHPGTMKGTIHVAGSSVAPEGPKESPGVQALGVGLAFLGAALLLRRR